MPEHKDSDREIVDDVVTACRGLAAYGCGSGIGGHVSVRCPGGEGFFINAFDRTLGEMTSADILKLDFAGRLIGEPRVVSLGWEFHAGIYGMREDVDAIVHSHGFWVTSLASLARPLKMRHNLCTLFHEDMVMSPDDRFENIGPALGTASTILIPWHGAITVGRSLPRAAALHVTLEEMARLDITVSPLDPPEIPEDARLGLRKLVDESAGYLEQTWELMRRKAASFSP